MARRRNQMGDWSWLSFLLGLAGGAAGAAWAINTNFGGLGGGAAPELNQPSTGPVAGGPPPPTQIPPPGA